MKLAAKNSQAFAKQNQRRAEKVQRIEEMEKRIAEKEKELAKLEKEIDLLQYAKDMGEVDNSLEISNATKRLEKYKAFFSDEQYQSIGKILGGNGALGVAEELNKIFNTIDTMPGTYDTDGQGYNAIAQLHYSKGKNDWYITEKDNAGVGVRQAFGLSMLLRNPPELGFISIEEIVRHGAELDLYWNKKTLSAMVDEQAAATAAKKANEEDKMGRFFKIKGSMGRPGFVVGQGVGYNNHTEWVVLDYLGDMRFFNSRIVIEETTETDFIEDSLLYNIMFYEEKWEELMAEGYKMIPYSRMEEIHRKQREYRKSEREKSKPQPAEEKPQAQNSVTEEPIVITGNEFGEFDTSTPEGMKKLRAEVNKSLRQLVKNKDSVFSKALNANVYFSGKGIDKYISLSANPVKLYLAAKIKEIIANGTKFKESENRYDDTPQRNKLVYHYLKTRVSMDKIVYGVRIVVREDHNGDYHWDLQVKDNFENILDSINENGTELLLATNPGLFSTVNQNSETEFNLDNTAILDGLQEKTALALQYVATLNHATFDSTDLAEENLNQALQVLEHNLRINEQEGNLDQAALERAHIDSIKSALSTLHSQVMLDSTEGSGKYVLNLFVEYKDENGNWVELKDDEEIEEDESPEDLAEDKVVPEENNAMPEEGEPEEKSIEVPESIEIKGIYYANTGMPIQRLLKYADEYGGDWEKIQMVNSLSSKTAAANMDQQGYVDIRKCPYTNSSLTWGLWIVDYFFRHKADVPLKDVDTETLDNMLYFGVAFTTNPFAELFRKILIETLAVTEIAVNSRNDRWKKFVYSWFGLSEQQVEEYRQGKVARAEAEMEARRQAQIEKEEREKQEKIQARLDRNEEIAALLGLKADSLQTNKVVTLLTKPNGSLTRLNMGDGNLKVFNNDKESLEWLVQNGYVPEISYTRIEKENGRKSYEVAISKERYEELLKAKEEENNGRYLERQNTFSLKLGYRLRSSDGRAFFDVNKTQYDYAVAFAEKMEKQSSVVEPQIEPEINQDKEENVMNAPVSEENPQVNEDRDFLNRIIRGEVDFEADTTLEIIDEFIAVAERYEGKGGEMEDLLDKAIDVYDDYIEKATRDLVD